MTKTNATNSSSNIRHIAFIMDGNGRWAQKRGMPREYGHKHGAKVLKTVIESCARSGIHCITFYAFSTENWKRPKKEVDALMNLLDEYLDQLINESADNDVRYRFIGELSVLKNSLQAKINILQNMTSDKKYTVNIALNYGARNELVSAFNKLISENKQTVTEDDINDSLYTAGDPELDLLVRTGGELRLSNFLLWQAAYSELYFTDTLWPDMDNDEVQKAIIAFNTRKRRFGGV